MKWPTVQALIQSLHGRGDVKVDGALHLLARHRLADRSEATPLRALLTELNRAEIVVYSPKRQTVRIAEGVSASDTDPSEPAIRVIQPDRPYQNVRHMREILRACRRYVWWTDPHFHRRALETLYDEADATRITEIRILSGPANADNAAAKEFSRFKTELERMGITAEWRVYPGGAKASHDRFIVTDGAAWNVPPVNTWLKGDYSEASPTNRPPFETWWETGSTLGS